MKTITCTEANIPQLAEDVFTRFKSYCDDAIKSARAIIYTNRMSTDPSPKESWSSQNEAIFSWNAGERYTSNGAQAAALLTQKVIFPCMEYALQLRQQHRLYYRAHFLPNGAEKVMLLNTKNKITSAASAAATSYFG